MSPRRPQLPGAKHPSPEHIRSQASPRMFCRNQLQDGNRGVGWSTFSTCLSLVFDPQHAKRTRRRPEEFSWRPVGFVKF